ncbi:MAG: sulfite exporter TauE/SafE family protein [Planctomycetes bacterium]|nr:sulfite exporter TauE/SafE family protein [Planctomycetota bacterium]
MCGPLALAFAGGTRGAVSYHSGRAVSYGALGVGLGAAGSALGSRELGAPTAWVSFALAFGIVVLVLLGERGAVRIPGLGPLVQRVLGRVRGLPPVWRAAVFGLGTPLLPCGLLWSACAGAAVAGSALAGGTVMLGFALGSLPVLLLAQTQALRLAQRLGPTTLLWVQRIAMLSAAAVLVWRGVLAMRGESCCH